MTRHNKNIKDDINKQDVSKYYISEAKDNHIYGEYYNKNVVYIYKDNSSVRVTYNNKDDEYIERKQYQA